MNWWTATSVSITNNSKILVVNTGDDIGLISDGDALVLAGQIVQIDRTYRDNNNQPRVLLKDNWTFGNQSQQPAKALPLPADLRTAAKYLRDVGQDAVTFSEVLAQVLSSTAPNLEIETATSGKINVVPYGRLTQDYTAKTLELTIISRDAYRTSVEANSGGKNTVVYDAQGNPNVMVVVPRFNYEDLGLPLLELGTGTATAFLTNGVARSEILIGKYLASTPAGTTGCSVRPSFQPRTSVNFDTAKSLCTNKGAGWHLMSRHEWAAIALWSLANNTVPRGNTFHGRAHDNPKETARRADNGVPGDSGGTGRTDTGKGPATWAHTHTDFGIHDLVGNVWEWLDQLKLQDGRIICTPDNQPEMAEASWPATTAWLDASTASGGNNVLSNSVTNRVGAMGDNQNAGNLASNTWQLTGRAAGYTPVDLLRRLLVEPAVNSGLPTGNLWARNFGERLPVAGGRWGGGSDAGLSALSLGISRSNSSSNIGFRPALFV